MMRQLPMWRLTSKFPAFYDCESGSAIEMTAKVYGAMQELINEYNKFAEETNKAIKEFESETTASNLEFRNNICNIMENYIKSIDMIVSGAVEYMKTNITQTATDIINEKITNGEIAVEVEYNAETEEINIVMK